jgi:SAM-dependent methyltransferase
VPNHRIKPHTAAWYDRLSRLQTGYYYPWHSLLSHGNGDQAFVNLVMQYLNSDKDVLEVGCGHGELALEFAPYCKSLLAYDRVPAYIELAQASAQQRGVHNVTFICADSSAQTNLKPCIPADPNSFDLLISHMGPLHWVEDARRVARPGAVLIQLNPLETLPPEWNQVLPGELRLPSANGQTMRAVVERRLASGGLQLHSCWTYDVPEYLPNTYEFYKLLSWGYTADEVPSWEDAQELLEGIYRNYTGPEGLVIPHRRLLWMALVEN